LHVERDNKKWHIKVEIGIWVGGDRVVNIVLLGNSEEFPWSSVGNMVTVKI
jgi:hypothetical protein